MAFSPFQKNKKCLMTDDLFLELTWEEGKSPEDDNELLGIIEGLDNSYLPEGQISAEKSLWRICFSEGSRLSPGRERSCFRRRSICQSLCDWQNLSKFAYPINPGDYDR